MQLRMPHRLGRAYKSPSQRTRVITEAWGEKNFYCLNCSSPRLERTRANTEAHDFLCPVCNFRYELKSKGSPFGRKIVDAAYKSMMEAVLSRKTPNLFAIHYDKETWTVRNLILIPQFVFTPSIIEKRKPLPPTARRSGWVGCNILLGNIPVEARVSLVSDGKPIPRPQARNRYRSLHPLQRLPVEARGWTLDVWNAIQKIGKKEFLLAEAYALAGDLEKLHPKNRNVEPKIRQQLQRLRDMGFVEFLERGRYRRK